MQTGFSCVKWHRRSGLETSLFSRAPSNRLQATYNPRLHSRTSSACTSGTSLRLSNATRRTKQTRQLGPGSVDFADVLHPTHGANVPPDIVRDRYHPQLCAMAIGSPTEFLHDLG